jgi:hypothetical protein
MTYTLTARKSIETVSAMDDETILAGHANAIRHLGKLIIEHAIEIGRRLADAKSRIPHGRWQLWLEREFAWTERTALNLIRVYELLTQSEFENFSDLQLPISGFYLLAGPSTPEAARKEIMQRAAAGERINVSTVRAVITRAKNINMDIELISALTKDAVPDGENEAKGEGQGAEEDENEVHGGEAVGVDAATPPRKSRHLSRSARWAEAVNTADAALTDLIELQQSYEDWRSNLPENFEATALGEKLDAVCDLDLQSALDIIQEAAQLDLPQGYGRD